MNNINTSNACLIGIGNSERGDDGLGWKFVEEVQSQGDFQGEIYYRYQLNIEDAFLVSSSQIVIFVDATSHPLALGYKWEALTEPVATGMFTHSLHPSTVVQLAQSLYPQCAQAYLLTIAGIHWDLGSTLSPAARQHLDAALAFWETVSAPIPKT